MGKLVDWPGRIGVFNVVAFDAKLIQTDSLMSPYRDAIWDGAAKAAISMLALLFSLLNSLGTPESPSFVISHWEMKDGLPLNKVRAIVQTRDGYLWVGTYNGLARFDGARFKVFDVANTPGLRNNAIESLCEDRDGRLWVGDNLGGISVLVNGHFQNVTLPNNWPDKPIIRLTAGGDGTVWAMNEVGKLLPLVKGVAGKPLDDVGLPGTLITDNSGQVWTAVAAKLCRLDVKQGAVPLLQGPSVVKGWLAIFPARDGGLWILDVDWLRRWKDGQWVEDRGHGNWGSIVLSAFLESRTGKIIGGSFKEGIHILDKNNGMEQIEEANGLSHNWVYCLCEDREGNIWVGTGNGGLNVLYPRRVTMVGPPDNWHSSAVLSVAPNSTGGLWIGTEGDGVYRLDRGEFSNLSVSKYSGQSVVNSVMEHKNGHLWAGTWASGALVLENGQFHSAFPETESNNVVFSIFQSSRGDIWVGTRGGLGLLHGGQWAWPKNHGDPSHFAVRCFAEQTNGAIWFGLDGGGVCRMKDEQLTQFKTSDGLVSDYVRTLHADADGSLWIGTRGGLSRFKNGKFAKVTTRNGLPSDVICQILDDGDGNYWMSSLGGLFRVEKSELNRCADGESDSVRCLLCDSYGGLATLEMSEQGQPAGCRTSDGRLWFATGRGLAMVMPKEVVSNPLPPPVKIEEVLVDGETLPLPPSSEEVSPYLFPDASSSVRRIISIPPGGRQFEFRYTGLSLANPARVAFRYRLEGLHEDWIDAGTRRSAFYTHLQPGTYTFRVLARNSDGIWNDKGAAMLISVRPYFWQTWWFKFASRAGGAAGIALTVLVIVRRRAHRKLAASERQRAIERERGRIARDIHDDLGSSLTRMVMLSESARGSLEQPKQAATDLAEICQTGRDLTLQLGEIVWAVNPEHDTLDSFATYVGKYAHDFLAKSGVRCRLDLPIKLPSLVLDSPVRHNVFLAFKEALNNAIKHANAKSVLVTLRLADQHFTLMVADDGCGLAEANSLGHGLGNMKRRLADVGGQCEIESTPDSGTRVSLTVPLANKK